MPTPKHFAIMLAAILCVSTLPLAAQSGDRASISHIYFGFEGGSGAPKRNVNIFEDGKVEINGERCADCRWHAPYRQSFNLSAGDHQEIKKLFDVDALERASRAPCTMDTAGRGRLREYINVSLESGSRSFDLVQSCVSPELTIVRDQLALAERILAKAEPTAKEQE